MFSTIFTILLVGLIIYYVVMIALDVMKQKSAEVAKQTTEDQDFDITEESKAFQSTEVVVKKTDPDYLDEMEDEESAQEEQETDFSEIEDVDTLKQTLAPIPAELISEVEIRKTVASDGLRMDELKNAVNRIAKDPECMMSAFMCKIQFEQTT